MNTASAKKLRNYLGSASWMRLLELGLLIMAAAAFVAGITLTGKQGDPSKAVEFYPAEDEMKGRYAYIDVVGVSDYVASRDTERWYAVIDRDGYGNIVKMSTSQFMTLKKHNDWWYSDEEDFIDPTRIYGMPNKISDELADVIADVFDYESRSDVADVFGKYYLDTTESPHDMISGIILFIAFAALLADIFLFITNASRNGTARRCIRRLNDLGLTDLAAEQLESPLTEAIGKDTTRLSQDFIYCRPLGTVMALSDIIWLYGHVQRYNGIVVSQTLRAGGKTLKAVPVCQTEKGKDGIGTEAFSHIMEVLSQRDPELMLGYSPEQQKLYNDRFKEEKARAKAAK